jgi:hypothetical protein
VSRRRHRLRRNALAPLAAAVAIVGGATAWTGLSGVASPRAAGGAVADHAARSQAQAGTGVPPLGIYTGPGEEQAAETAARELGGKVAYALDFLPKDSTWTALTDPTWLAARWTGSPFDMVLGVPMLPASGGTLAQGAAGAFDPQFDVLAQRLVADGFGSAVLMVGYQPDDSGTPWYVASAATASNYVRFWDRIATTMGSVPGAHFVFEWDAGDAATSPVSPAAMYPGDAAVDIVATDAFDVVPEAPSQSGRWTAVLNERYGPAWMAAFAAAHHKPMAIAMWGEVPRALGGVGDDASYVTSLLGWAAAEKIQMCVLWDYQALAVTGGGFPAAEAAIAGAVAAPAAATTADVVGPAAAAPWDAAQTEQGRFVRTIPGTPMLTARVGKTTRWRRPGSGT